jgi:hypothetical protein
VLSEVGDKEQTNKSLSIRSNPLFTVRWTCLSLVAIKQIVDDNRLQELAKFALEGIVLFQTNLGSRDTATMALTAAQKMDDNLKKAWEAVLDLRPALKPWSPCRSERGSKNGAPVGAPRRVVPARRLSIGPNMITDKLPTYNKTIQYSYRHLPVPWGSRPVYINHSSKSPAPSVIVLHARTLR